jgi:hypothetical protein
MKRSYSMTFIAALFGASLVVFSFGCATSYHSSSYTGGYSDTQLAPDIFRVVFRGNAYAHAERVQDFALLRASELVLQHGFGYFATIDENNSSVPVVINTPGQSYTTGSGSVVGNTMQYSGQTTYYPGETYTLYKSKTGLLIRGFVTKPEGIFAFDAAFLQQSVKEKYQIKSGYGATTSSKQAHKALEKIHYMEFAGKQQNWPLSQKVMVEVQNTKYGPPIYYDLPSKPYEIIGSFQTAGDNVIKHAAQAAQAVGADAVLAVNDKAFADAGIEINPQVSVAVRNMSQPTSLNGVFIRWSHDVVVPTTALPPASSAPVSAPPVEPK